MAIQAIWVTWEKEIEGVDARQASPSAASEEAGADVSIGPHQRPGFGANLPEEIELMRGPDQPPEVGTLADVNGDARTGEIEWKLASLDLTEGTVITLHAMARDYRPRVGHAVQPRRITIVSPDELSRRLADRQVGVVQRLREVLATQRRAKAELNRSEAVGGAQRAMLQDRQLRSASAGQRDVVQQIGEGEQSIVKTLFSLREDIERNGLDVDQTAPRLNPLLRSLEEMILGPLPTILESLTSLQKQAETRDIVELPEFASATTLQQQVIDELEKQLDELSQWADSQQLASDLARLRTEQSELESTTLEMLHDRSTQLPQESDERDRMQSSAIKRQADLARRFDKTRSRIASRLREQELGDRESRRLQDALDQAESDELAADFRDAANALEEGRLGDALRRQQQVGDGLQQMLDAIRGIVTGNPAERMKNLDELADELRALREEVAQQQSDAGSSQPQQALADRADRASRQLERMRADEAAELTAGAAESLSPSSQAAQSSEPNSSAAQQQRRDAERQLAEAEGALAEEREQVREEVAQQSQSLLNEAVSHWRGVQERLNQATEQVFERQRDPLGGLTPEGSQAAADLGGIQQMLRLEMKEMQQSLPEAGPFLWGLDRLGEKVESIADQLLEGRVSENTLQLQQDSLAQLDRLAAALTDSPRPANGAEESPTGEENGTESAEENQEAGPPPPDVRELKFLRETQQHLQDETSRLGEEVDGDVEQRRAELAREQQELAEQVKTILDRRQQHLETGKEPSE